MTEDRPREFGVVAAQFLLGGFALALVTVGSFWLHGDLATAAFTYLVVVSLSSLLGSFGAAVLLSLLSAAALAYFFAPPVFDFRVHDPKDLLALAAFLLSSLTVTHVIRAARRDKEAATDAESRLRRSQNELRDSERDWREVFEHNPVMYFMVDADGTVVNVNTFGAAQLGYSASELVGRSVLHVFLPEDHASVRGSIAMCVDDVGRAHTWEIRKARRDGTILWVRENAKALRRADGDLVVLIACEDVTESRRTEDALKRSEAYLAQAQEISRTGSFGWNVVSGEVFWSRETFRIFGCEPTAKPGIALVLARTHPDDRAAVKATVDRAVGDGRDFEHEYRLLLPDGTVKHLRALARARKDPSGAIEFVGAVSDVTAAREAEQRLRRSEAYLAEAQRLSHTSSWSWDVGRRDFAYRSAEVYRLFGFSPDERVSAEAIQARIPEDDMELLDRVVRQAVQARTGQLEFEFRVVLPDGSVKRVHSVAHPVVGDDGRVSEIVGTHVDVTEQRAVRERLEKAVEALRESEQRFRDYAETASDWLWESGPDHRITRISDHPKAEGILSAGLVGRHRWDVACDVASEPEKWRRHREALDAHLPFRDLTYRTVDRNGAAMYVQTSGRPFFDATGVFLGYRGVSTDITSTIRAEEAEQALRKAQAELAHVARVTALGELVASIAHEVNQPLAAVVANADACRGWLDRAQPDLDAARRSLDWIAEDGNRAGEVIRRVRALAKKSAIERTPIDLNETVRESMALVRRELASHDVALDMRLAPGLPALLGDRVQLQQVTINLVMNGIEAMHAVSGRRKTMEILTGRIGDGVERGHLFLSVSDEGVGIAEEDPERLFAPFFTTKTGGLGMGLSICRSIVEAHEGRLSAFRKDHGATFRITLPPRSDGEAP